MSITQILVDTATPNNVRNAEPIPALIVRGEDLNDLRARVEEALGHTIRGTMKRIYPMRIQVPHQPPTRDAELQIMPAQGYNPKIHGKYYMEIEAYLREGMQPQ